jgi:hypothetical protein
MLAGGVVGPPDGAGEVEAPLVGAGAVDAPEGVAVAATGLALMLGVVVGTGLTFTHAAARASALPRAITRRITGRF